MSSRTRLFLLLGCALVLALEAPRTANEVAAGWRGPYAKTDTAPEASPGTAAASAAHALRRGYPVPRPHGRLELARR